MNKLLISKKNKKNNYPYGNQHVNWNSLKDAKETENDVIYEQQMLYFKKRRKNQASPSAYSQENKKERESKIENSKEERKKQSSKGQIPIRNERRWGLL